MTVIISGSAGIQNPLGSAAAPSESNTTNSNTGAYFPSGTTYGIATNGSNAMYIDASQNVGIGQTPTAYGATVRNVEAYIAGASGFTLVAANTASVKTEVTSSESSLLGQVGTRSNHPLVIKTNDTERMRIDTSGNIGINTSSINAKMQFPNNIASTAGSSNQLSLYYASTTAAFGFGISTGQLTYNCGDGVHAFYTGGNTSPVERMRIDSSGNLLVGTTSGGSIPQGAVVRGGLSNTYMSIGHANGTGSGNWYMEFLYNQTTIGYIAQNSTTSVNYYGYIVNPSDQKLKTNITDAPSATSIVDKIKVRSFDWVADKRHQTYGLIAQELDEVYSEAVEAPITEDTFYGVDYTKLVPVLVKVIQELSAEVTALKAKVGA